MNIAESTVVLTLDMETQRRLVAQVREVIAASPLVRPVTVGGAPMSVRVTSAGDLGWVGDGEYKYTRTDSRGRSWPKMPDEWREIADRAVALDPRHDGRMTRWDSAIVNWYDPTASLGLHADKSEADRTLPIVTISLGDAASWLVEVDGYDGPERSRTRLESGAVTVLAGRLRNARHSIERIIRAPMFSPLDVAGRISITIRQAGM